MHLAAALGVPLVAIFTDSEPALTGPVGRGPIKVLGEKGEPPGVQEVLGAVRRSSHNLPHPDAPTGPRRREHAET